MARTGRRPDNPQTRAAVLTAAREAFAARGYRGATIRQIAAGAGVDPALVHHYFGTKDGLFVAAVASEIDPRRLLWQVFDGPAETLGERLVVRFLALWEGGAGANASALLRTVATEERFGPVVRERIVPLVVNELVTRVGVDAAEAPARAALLASQLSGLVNVRYVLRIEPVAGASIAWVAAAVGPTVQRYLTGALVGPAM